LRVLLEPGGPREWLAVPVVALALSIAGAWLLLEHSADAGIARSRAFATEAPRRTGSELAELWIYLGDREAERQDWPAAQSAMRHAAIDEPSPSVLLKWALAAEQTGDFEDSRRAWALESRRSPGDRRAWSRLAQLDLRS